MLSMLRSCVASAFVLGVLLLPPADAGAATLELVPTSANVTLGQVAEVELRISGLGNGVAPSLGAWALDVVYGPELSFQSATFSGLLGDALALESASVVTPGAGMVSLLEASVLSAPTLDALQPDTFVLATLTFDTLALGSTALSIANPLLLGAEVPAAALRVDSATGTTFDVVASNPIPEPGAALVFALGVVLANRGSRRP